MNTKEYAIFPAAPVTKIRSGELSVNRFTIGPDLPETGQTLVLDDAGHDEHVQGEPEHRLWGHLDEEHSFLSMVDEDES